MSIIMVFYLISVLHNLDCFLGIILFISVMIMIITFGHIAVIYEQEGFVPSKIKFLKIIIATTFGVGFFSCFIPSQLTMYSMVGVKYLSDSQIPEKVTKLVNIKLDEFIVSQAKDKK